MLLIRAPDNYRISRETLCRGRRHAAIGNEGETFGFALQKNQRQVHLRDSNNRESRLFRLYKLSEFTSDSANRLRGLPAERQRESPAGAPRRAAPRIARGGSPPPLIRPRLRRRSRGRYRLSPRRRARGQRVSHSPCTRRIPRSSPVPRAGRPCLLRP